MSTRKETTSVTPFGLKAEIYHGIRDTLAQARAKACAAINFAMVEAYWDVGRQIDGAIGERAEYGKGLLQYVSERL
ncbi:MAG: DUF1016 N-terminal domain-containing protein, partial [Zoogloeaceae bacterium]|nr:DUF1016 N-terminal domain-containing protein [Zoogloeaceae bacterium]